MNVAEVNTPVLFYNVDCNNSHSDLLHCVDLQHIGIGIHNCDGIAGIVCANSTMHTQNCHETVEPTVTGVILEVKNFLCMCTKLKPLSL